MSNTGVDDRCSQVRKVWHVLLLTPACGKSICWCSPSESVRFRYNETSVDQLSLEHAWRVWVKTLDRALHSFSALLLRFTHLSGSSSPQRPGRPYRWRLQPQRWGSCRAPGQAPRPFWQCRWQPSVLALASRGLSRSGTWSLQWWWGPRWSQVPWG